LITFAVASNRNDNTNMQAKIEQRYARHIGLPQIGKSGQSTLLHSHALIVGMGGLGSPVALYLTAAGVGELTLCDYDRVDLSNLQRQVLHSTADIGELKTESATATLKAINPEVKINTIDYYADEEELGNIAQSANIILDCTDNFESRFGLNRISRETLTPLISGAAIRWEGQVTAFDPNQEESPCYHCLYPGENLQDASCAMEGVVAPLVGVIGTLQAQAAMNILLGQPSLVGRVLLYDANLIEWQSITLKRNPNCPECA
jgi:molybdopterin/thiamine biosynthesis adenylyltransferase